jgi:hypothetical protein
MTIIRNAKMTIMATRIQNTWRMYKIDKDAHFERLEARYNKLANPDLTHIKYCTNEKIDIDDIDDKTDKSDKSVKFSHDIEGIDGDMKDFVDITTLVDGTQRNKSIFTNAILLWYNSLSKIDFFDGACKKYVDSGSSVYWDEWLIDIIERLENGEKVIIWGNLGSHKKLYPLVDKHKIKAFHNAWTKYNVVYVSSDEDDSDIESEDVESDKIVNDMENFVKDMKKMSLNPNAKTFVPGQSWSPKKRNAEDILMQLDEKIQRLIDMQCVHNTPICYAQVV